VLLPERTWDLGLFQLVGLSVRAGRQGVYLLRHTIKTSTLRRERDSKELILRKLRKHFKSRKIGKCNYLGLLDVTEASMSLGLSIEFICFFSVFYL
jgi:hypothetical protein